MTTPAVQGIVDASGKPMRAPKDARCPQCGAGPDQRVETGGFGGPAHLVCLGGCSPAHEWEPAP